MGLLRPLYATALGNLHRTALYCTALHSTALHYTQLRSTSLSEYCFWGGNLFFTLCLSSMSQYSEHKLHTKIAARIFANISRKKKNMYVRGHLVSSFLHNCAVQDRAGQFIQLQGAPCRTGAVTGWQPGGGVRQGALGSRDALE